MPPTIRTLLLLGGNEGDPRITVDAAARQIAHRIGPVMATSRDHWTEPWGFTDPRLFLNRALLVGTVMEPTAMMHECLAIERELGRQRVPGEGYRSRAIDIDVLFFGDHVIDAPGLSVPHPRLHERLFALGPAADIAPAWVHPVLGRSIIDLLTDLRHRTPLRRTDAHA